MAKLVFYTDSKVNRDVEKYVSAINNNPDYGEAVLFFNFDDLESQSSSYHALVLHWNSMMYPVYAVERLCQHPRFSQYPIIILFELLSVEQSRFIKEYSTLSLVKIDQQSPTGVCNEIIRMINALNDSSKESKIQKYSRAFYSALHSENFKKAKTILAGHLETYCNPDEIAFLTALLAKHEKKFDEAIGCLEKYVKISMKSLDARFINLIGNIEYKRKNFKQAQKYLEHGIKISPLNLKRRFIYAKTQLETGDREVALKNLIKIYNYTKTYEGIHIPIIENHLQKIVNPEEVTKLSGLLGFLTDKELQRLIKKAKKIASSDKLKRFNEMVIRELSIRANNMFNRLDYYGALKIYSVIETILDPANAEKNRSLYYCKARVYYRALDFENALITINEAEKMSNVGGQTLDKIKAMKSNILKHLQKAKKTG